MDPKYKIIVSIFFVIFFLYVMHFVLSYMNNQKIKEKFITDDNSYDTYGDDKELEERFTPDVDNIVTTSEHDPKYKLRLDILAELDKLNIKDKTIKSNLLDYLYDNKTLEILLKRNDNERKEFIDQKYKTMIGEPEMEIKKIDVKIRPENKNTKEGFDSKINILIDHVSNLQNGLGELKNINSYQQNDPSNNGVPITTVQHIMTPPTTAPPMQQNDISPPIPGINEIEKKKILIEAYENIEGFENKKQYTFL
jgi:hypothetical protein